MSQSLLVLVLTILASLATTVQAVSPCNFDRRASELHRYVNLNLVPEKGYSVPIHSDFDRWIDSAPPLERTHQ
ncbi:MAG: hypothetical protein K0U93_27155, partial [Gammaproteobacteria bacterium]|nr:hypothetical protein [Gammaproteobacteria bacterium]